MPARVYFAAACVAMLASPLAAFDINAMSEAEREAFRAEVRAYLVDNPEILLEAIDALEQRQATERATEDSGLIAENAKEIFDDGYSWTGGNPNGDITIVEFLDYRCGYCQRAHPLVNELIASDGNIRYVIKEFPILGEQSLLASRFAIAVKDVAGDAAYAEVHNSLMNLRGNVTMQALSNLSEQLDLEPSKIFDAMKSPVVQERIAANRALAQRLSINGTPSFIFERQLRRGYLPLDEMRDIVAEERAAG